MKPPAPPALEIPRRRWKQRRELVGAAGEHAQHVLLVLHQLERNLLERAELISFLDEERTSAYDLIAAADVLCYFGALDGAFVAFAHALKPGGVLLLPVGPVLDQNFVRIVRSADGARFTETKLFSVRYVPLTTAAAQLQRM